MPTKFRQFVKELHHKVDPKFVGLPSVDIEPSSSTMVVGGKVVPRRARRRSVDLFVGGLVRKDAAPAGSGSVTVPPARSPTSVGAAREVFSAGGPGSTFAGGYADGGLPPSTPHAVGASLGGRFSVPATPGASNFAWD